MKNKGRMEWNGMCALFVLWKLVPYVLSTCFVCVCARVFSSLMLHAVQVFPFGYARCFGG